MGWVELQATAISRCCRHTQIHRERTRRRRIPCGSVNGRWRESRVGQGRHLRQIRLLDIRVIELNVVLVVVKPMQLVDVAHRRREGFAVRLEGCRRAGRLVSPRRWQHAVPEVVVVPEFVKDRGRPSVRPGDKLVEPTERHQGRIARQGGDARPARWYFVVVTVRVRRLPLRAQMPQ